MPAAWTGCQVTSKPYGDPAAVALTRSSFETGGLNRDSFARPGKLFTASEAIVVRAAGTLKPAAHRSVAEAVIKLIRSGLK
jgi:mRNA interferase MazF